MNELRYYFSIFLRRLHYFLFVAVSVAAVSVIVAMSLPPAYVAQMRLLLEAPQIPSELAASTVTTPEIEQLEIIEQRLMTRENLLAIARSQEVFEAVEKMSADDVVEAMRARTVIRRAGRRDDTPLMTLSFEARSAAIAAGVLNAYLTRIEERNIEFRTALAGNTLEFFQQEVARLGADLDRQSARILEFKNANADALPEGLDYRMTQQSLQQERLSQVTAEISTLARQRERLVQMFEATGQVGAAGPLSPVEQQLQDLRRQLDEAMAVYSPENPRVRMLEARIAQIEARLASQPASTQAPADDPRRSSLLDIQLAEIDARIELLREQQGEIEARLEGLQEAISKTPANAIALEELNRSYANIEGQYNTAVGRLAQASTGERIEALSRGQRLSVIEPPVAPSRPTKPNRLLIAGGGSAFGIFAGLALVVLLEVLGRPVRRPADLVQRLGIRPLATIPYTRTGPEVFWKRLLKTAVYLGILLGIPAAVYAVHLFYLPLDLLADRAMDKMGMRW